MQVVPNGGVPFPHLCSLWPKESLDCSCVLQGQDRKESHLTPDYRSESEEEDKDSLISVIAIIAMVVILRLKETSVSKTFA